MAVIDDEEVVWLLSLSMSSSCCSFDGQPSLGSIDSALCFVFSSSEQNRKSWKLEGTIV